jgi:hypothetical protein
MFELTAAYIVAQFMGCIFFGLALTTFILAIRTLCVLPFSSFSRARWALFAVCIATTLIGTISVSQMLRHMLNAFVYYAGTGGASAELTEIKDPMNILHVMILFPL